LTKSKEIQNLRLETDPKAFTFGVSESIFNLLNSRRDLSLPSLDLDLLIDPDLNFEKIYDSLDSMGDDAEMMLVLVTAFTNEYLEIADDINQRDMLQKATRRRIAQIEGDITSSELHDEMSPDVQTAVTSQSTYQDFLNRILSKGPVSQLGRFIEPSEGIQGNILAPQNNTAAETPKIL